MARMTLVLCDVKPCTSPADREFEVNGKTLYVCGEQCFTKFWSREYCNWKDSPYKTQITFHTLSPMNEYGTKKVADGMNDIDIFSSDLKILKPRQVN
jgi:hypothetical protein